MLDAAATLGVQLEALAVRSTPDHRSLVRLHRTAVRAQVAGREVAVGPHAARLFRPPEGLDRELTGAPWTFVTVPELMAAGRPRRRLRWRAPA